MITNFESQRRTKKITQAQLAKMIGCSQSAVSLLEKGQLRSPKLLARAADILCTADQPSEWLLCDVGEKP